MPFTFSPAVVPNYAPIGAGISQFGQDIGQALQAYGQNKQQQAFNDSVFDYLAKQSGPGGTLPGVVPADVLQRYHDMSPKEKTGAILGAMNNANMMRTQQQQDAYRRYLIEHGNMMAARTAGFLEGQARPGQVWSDDLQGWASPAQAATAKRQSYSGHLMTNYGLTPDQIIGPDASKQHEAGNVSDPQNPSNTFTPADNGQWMRIGGPTGAVMPLNDFNIYKRQLLPQGQTPTAAGGGAGGGVNPYGVSAGSGLAPNIPIYSQGQQAGVIDVRSPTGVQGTVPVARLQDALAAGYTQIGQ